MDQHRRTPHAQAPSPSVNASMNSARRLRAGLLPLKSALIAAERLTPSRPPRPDTDPNEELAMQLIGRIKRTRPLFLPGMRIEPPQPMIPVVGFEMAGRDV